MTCTNCMHERALARTWIVRMGIVGAMGGLLLGLSAPMLWGHCS